MLIIKHIKLYNIKKKFMYLILFGMHQYDLLVIEIQYGIF